MKSHHVISAALTAALCFASETVFSVNDDVFAYPQVCVAPSCVHRTSKLTD